MNKPNCTAKLTIFLWEIVFKRLETFGVSREVGTIQSQPMNRKEYSVFVSSDLELFPGSLNLRARGQCYEQL